MAQREIGLIHIYCGDGKGKTTAAAGLAIRVAGAGKKVVFAQFLKSGDSSEIKVLNQIDGIQIMHAEGKHGFFSKMSESERLRATEDYQTLFACAKTAVEDGVQLLILDEIIHACNRCIIPQDLLMDFLQNKPECLEVVLTGRDPSKELLSVADYVTEMQKIKHPYEQGIHARKGIEY